MPSTKKFAEPQLKGRTIASVRQSTRAEQRKERFSEPFVVIELDDGTVIYALRDEQGSGPGMLVCRKGRVSFYIRPDLVVEPNVPMVTIALPQSVAADILHILDQRIDQESRLVETLESADASNPGVRRSIDTLRSANIAVAALDSTLHDQRQDESSAPSAQDVPDVKSSGSEAPVAQGEEQSTAEPEQPEGPNNPPPVQDAEEEHPA